MSTVVVRAIYADDVDMDVFDARRVDGFTGLIGQTRIEQSDDVIVALTGAGARDESSPERLARAAAAISRRVCSAFAVSEASDPVTLEVDIDSFSPSSNHEAVAAIARGIAWGGYRFRMTGETTFASRSLPARADASSLDAWERGAHIAAAVRHARDLVNLPAAALTPGDLARRARELLEPLGVRVVLRDAAELADGGYGGIIAIGRGSVNPPLLLELAIGDGPPEYAFVAKGVTFDSGGLSLKSAVALMDMKSDMAGAAAVIAAFSLLPSFAPGRSFSAVIPVVENMPGAHAVRPGDVVRVRNGATLEILDTDFEGRVILVDALARATEMGPRRIVDLATLTYASRNALGDDFAALVATDDSLASRLLAAGERSGDRLWRMPLQAGLHAQITSEIADYKNFPGVPHARVSTAALLLSQFVSGIPWAHVDMAGPAFRHTADAAGAAGGTGYGVTLIAELIQAP